MTIKDLDWSDVEHDAENMRQSAIDDLGNQLEQCDLFSVFMTAWLWLECATFEQVLDSEFGRSLLQGTQRNPSKARSILLRMYEINKE